MTLLNAALLICVFSLGVCIGYLASFYFRRRNEQEKDKESLRETLQLKSIEHLLSPVKEALQKFDVRVREIELARVGAYEGLNQQVRQLFESQNLLRLETSRLVNALKMPQVRGRWGEIQLRRVVEIAGLLNQCEFQEQLQTVDDLGQRRRPDLVVHLPNNRTIVIDAKVSLAAYLEFIACDSPELRQAKLKEHAKQLRAQVEELSRKTYWEQFKNSPDYVVLFVPGEVFLSAALEVDSELLEASAQKGVLITTPILLLSLLKTVGQQWKDERLAENSERIRELGKELYKRLSDMSNHVSDLGTKLKGAVDSYNRFLGTLESRVNVSARRFRDLDCASTQEIEESKKVEVEPRLH